MSLGPGGRGFFFLILKCGSPAASRRKIGRVNSSRLQSGDWGLFACLPRIVWFVCLGLFACLFLGDTQNSKQGKNFSPGLQGRGRFQGLAVLAPIKSWQNCIFYSQMTPSPCPPHWKLFWVTVPLRQIRFSRSVIGSIRTFYLRRTQTFFRVSVKPIFSMG